MSKKTVNFDIEEVMPLAQEIMEFLIKKDGGKVTPESTAMIIGALQVSQRFFMEEFEKFGGSVAMNEMGH